ncbi:hypothetical protein C1645_737418 [Glomus cerebriforme]|uniref:CCHC-type domain-containing protein n=1 Tax=Glomus cerebriforme TaxID=658196 RepID=A0A397SY80_9GLOM|nr:hypothetical protein C1645_737418 [Glomus cerebriforme]
MEAYMMRINGNSRKLMRNNNGNNVNWSQMTCFKCEKKGHTSKICRENQQGINRRNNQVNYLDEEYYDKEYDVYNMEQDEYDKYEYDKYDAYEIENEDYIEENDMYPVPTRKSEKNKNRVINDERERRRNVQWQQQ